MAVGAVHQLLVGASPGDAVTNAALDLRSALRGLGVGPSEVFARFYDPALEGDVLPLSAMGPGSAEDVLLYRASIGEPEVASFLAGRPERLGVLYHNISPAAAFEQWDPGFAAKLRGGREEVAALAGRAEVAVTESSFNARDLRAWGFRDVRVTPLVVDVERLRGLPSHEPTERHLRERVAGPVVLTVAQVLPHKRIDVLLQAYHALVTYLEPTARLIVVGPSRFPRYTEALETLIRELHLTGAWIAGRVEDSALAAFYRRAQVFVTVSEHEGFCVPVLEAMAFDVPVLARRAGAVPETVGDAGVLLPASAGPLLVAEAMAELLSSEGLRAGLVAAGRERVAALSPAVSRAALLDALRGLL